MKGKYMKLTEENGKIRVEKKEGACRMELKAGNIVYFLYRSTWSPKTEDTLAIPMEIKRKNDEEGNEGLQAVSLSKEINWIKFDVTEKTIKDLTRPDYPSLFRTKEEALARYQADLNKRIDSIMNKSKKEFLTDLYHSHVNPDNGNYDMEEIRAIEEKILQEFGVSVRDSE